jgi:hypothetical protein
MTTQFTFRLSTYLTLALACLCVGYAEHDVLPEVAFFALAAIVALAVLFHFETRIELLSIPAANTLALCLGLANLVWGACRVMWELKSKDFQNTPWQLLFSAMLGPLLMSLMPAKLARREKHAGDYWALHGMGLVAVCLAGAIAEHPITFLLIALYAACATWSLSLFYLQQASGSILRLPGGPVPTPTYAVQTRDSKHLGFRRTIWFIFLAGAVASLLYLVTPRSTAEKFTFGQAQVTIAYSGSQMTDLNQTGELKATDKIAFEVTAEEDGRPKTDVAADQRWRGQVLRNYNHGIWTNASESKLPGIDSGPRGGGAWSPPNLGPGQCTFSFTVPSPHRADFLADPIAWAVNQPSPIASLKPTGMQGWRWNYNGSFSSNVLFEIETNEPTRYIQIWRSQSDPDVTPPFRVTDIDPEVSLRYLWNKPIIRVKEYSNQLVEGLIREGKLPRDCRDHSHVLSDSEHLAVRPEFHDLIAQEFTRHLATSPDFNYSTKLRREMKEIDPIEEFLLHTREGHCERFATALALLLRYQGIPAYLVLGFKGCEPTEVSGKYIVREEHAHAWVQALVQDPQALNRSSARPICRWRSLDPTPGGYTGSQTLSTEVWSLSTLAWLKARFKEYFSEYTSERRQHVIRDLSDLLFRWETPAIVSCAVLAMWLVRIYLRRRNRLPTPEPAPNFEMYIRLVHQLRLSGFTPLEGDTPLEFASRTTLSLRENPATVALAEVPLDWVEAYYEMRFGGAVLANNRIAILQSRLDELARITRKK